MDSIVLYGGGFDPIHNGHLRLAKAASKAFGADVFFIPNRTPPWKTPNAPLEARLEMIRLALEESLDPRLKLSLYEIENGAEVNYSIDTVRHFVKEYPDKKIYLLIGADEANLFYKWKEPDEIARLAQIAVIPRPDMEISSEMVKRYHMVTLDYHESGDVSSSGVRQLSHADIPISVRDYI